MRLLGLFVVLPLSLTGAGLAPAAQWQLYLPVVLLAIGLMVPLIWLAEATRAGPGGAVLLGAALALVAALFGLAGLDGSLLAIGALLTVLFTVFNIMEALLPTLVSKAARAGDKGTAAGVFSSAQFMGAFLGGTLGGIAHGTLGPHVVYLLGALAALVWFGVALTLRPPTNLREQVLSLAQPLVDPVALRRRLLAVPGVADAVIASDEDVAYVKVDSAALDSATLRAACGMT